MADISQIKLPNGDTYNLVDETSGYTSNVGTITKIKTTAGTHNTIDISSGAATFNVPTTAAHVGINFGYTTNGNNRAVLQDSNGNLYVTQKDDNTTYSSKAAANGGTDVSLVTTGEKYTWNSKTSNVGTVTSVAATGSGGITISGSPITSTGTLTIGLNLSTAINGLSEGASPAQLNDYAVVQYAGGGTATTTYHRRKLTNLIVGKAVADQNGDTIHTTYLKLTGGNVTGPVSFGDSVSIDDLTAGQLVVNGGASIVNNLQVNTINGVTVGFSPKFTDNNSFKSFYGTCDTAAATAAKVITLSVTTGWQLVAGTVVGVKFTNTNTAQNPTLNINGTGAKNIYVNNATITTSNLWYAGEAGRIHFYMYDGSQWIFMGHSYDWNSDLKVTQTNSTTNADYRVLLSANANDTTETNTSFKNTNLRYNPSTGTLKIKGFDSISSNFKSINCDVSKSEVTAQNSSLTTSSADTDWFQALVKAICIKYPNVINTIFRGTISPNSNKYYEIFIYDTSTVDSTTKLPQHSFGRALNYGGGFTKFGTDSYVWRFSNVDTNTNTTYSAGTGLSLSSTTFSVKLGYTTSGNNRAVQADSNGNLYVTQKDDNTTALTSMTGTLGIDHGGTGKTSALAAITNLGGPYLLVGGTEITASSNLDSAYKAMGTYYSGDSTRSQTLTGTVPITGSGFKMITSIGYRAATLHQFISSASNDLLYRSTQDTGSTWTKWYKFTLLPSGSDNKTFAAVGGSTTPVYVNSSGVVTACSYTIAKSVPADAVFTDTNTKVNISNTNPTTGTWYYPTWHTGTSGTGVTLNANDGLRYYALQGTASALGHSYIQVGNATAEGTAGNKRGHIRIYSQSSGYTDLQTTSSTSNFTITFPAHNATVVTTGGGQQINGVTTFYREGTTANNYPAGIVFKIKDTTIGSTYGNAYIYAYHDHDATSTDSGGNHISNGSNMVINSGGGMFLGSGEAPINHYNALKGTSYTAENAFLTADSTLYVQANAGTIANRLGFYLNSSHQIIPCKAETATNNVGSIGTSSYKWNAMYATTFYGALSGNATTATTASVVSYTTTAPTAANSSGLKFAVLTSDPATKYNGWVYLIKG